MLKSIFNPTGKTKEESRVLGTACAFGSKELKEKIDKQFQNCLLCLYSFYGPMNLAFLLSSKETELQ